MAINLSMSSERSESFIFFLLAFKIRCEQGKIEGMASLYISIRACCKYLHSIYDDNYKYPLISVVNLCAIYLVVVLSVGDAA